MKTTKLLVCLAVFAGGLWMMSVLTQGQMAPERRTPMRDQTPAREQVPSLRGGPCTVDSDCGDGIACTTGTCVGGTCKHIPGPNVFGDIAPPGGNGIVDLDDILCVLDGFANANDCPKANLVPCGVASGGIDLDDILAVLDAFAGDLACPPENEACCLPNDKCYDADVNCCLLAGGDPQGPGTTCATVSCVIVPPPDPTIFPTGPTTCPVIPTSCPAVPTACPAGPTLCGFTICPGVPTFCGPGVTACPVIPTVCVAGPPTACPGIITACPAVATLCVAPVTACALPTICPIIPTICGAPVTTCPGNVTFCDVTNCPSENTFCPFEFSVCPCDPTRCPVVDTHCPRDITNCPIIPTQCHFTFCPNDVTRCPFQFTSCPPHDDPTIHPYDPTNCPNVATQCPQNTTICQVTVCPTSFTQCPNEITFCPSNVTSCPCDFTRCPGVLTQCPNDSPTLCPVQPNCDFTFMPQIPTFCPQGFTSCPQTMTICNTPVTNCAANDTTCPVFTLCTIPPLPTFCGDPPTQCPDGTVTVCPVIQTLCPALETTCPRTPTFCPCDQTRCPIVMTICPQLQTTCPGPNPTMCEFTSCPTDLTLCPPNPAGPCPDPTMFPTVPTACPRVVSQCPCDPTRCPVVLTECPQSFTECPQGPTLCEFTVCQGVVTFCPTQYTFCPEITTICTTGGYTQCAPTPTICQTPITGCAEFPTQCQQTTICPEIPTECPQWFTACPRTVTSCPCDQTTCPPMNTSCPEFITQCQIGVPTFCQFTVCPPSQTFCPTDNTFCPTRIGGPCEPLPTLMPVSVTYCPNDLVTQCPNTPSFCEFTFCPVAGSFTICVIFETACPFQTTSCPCDLTRCPGNLTQCPGEPTLCPQAPPNCDFTFFPQNPTFCAISHTTCPQTPTACTFDGFTQCPGTVTVCPDIPTQCGMPATYCADGTVTVCPIQETSCPAWETTCPKQITSCPCDPTTCGIITTYCPQFDTVCPFIETQCTHTFCPVVTTFCPAAPGTCPVVGACCLPNCVCIETTDTNCANQGGVYFPGVGCPDIEGCAPGTPCGSPADTDCDNPDTCNGSVCLPNNEPAGTPCGPGQACDGNGSCVALVPCCFSNANCMLVLPGNCGNAVGGTVVDHCPANGRCIPPGDDCWVTPCGGGTYDDFSSNPIPADFFAPSSAPFTGIIILGGDGTPDTTIRRFDAMLLDGPPETIPIELVQLSLTSCSPITVVINNVDTLWDVRVDPSPVQPPQGSMTVTKQHVNGGTFRSEFYVQARFTFEEVGVIPPNIKILDTADEGRPPVLFETTDTPKWVHTLSIPHTPCGVYFVPGVENQFTKEQCCTDTYYAGGQCDRRHWEQCTFCSKGACCTMPSPVMYVCANQAEDECLDQLGDYKGDGTTCDDSDGDGLADVLETGECCGQPAAGPFDCASGVPTSSTDPDTDDDGLSDGQEVANGTNPCVPEMESCCGSGGNCTSVLLGACTGSGGTVVDHCPAGGRCIPPGNDCFVTSCGGGTHIDFCNDPIPADFFAPGSEPFSGIIILGGPNDGLPDTTIRRFDAMLLDGPPETIPIELVELRLVSCSPIITDPDTFWDVGVDLSLVQPPPGSMTVTKQHSNGGVFTSRFYVQPLFIFREVGNPFNVKVLDTGEVEGRPPIFLESFGTHPWVYDSQGEVHPQCGQNFVPGATIDPATEPCCVRLGHSSDVFYANPFGPLRPTRVRHVTAPSCTVCQTGACCNSANGTCSESDAASCTGQYKGAGTSCQDTDNDGLPDWWENHDCRGIDLNCDGVLRDLCNTGTNPNDADTDGDGFGDGFELGVGCDPCAPSADTNMNGTPDECDCGDNQLAGSEQCDQGALNGTPGSCCSGTCTFVAAGTECRPPAPGGGGSGACDVAEACDGVSADCPYDAVLAAGTVCRPAAGACDVAEACDGVSADCPSDAVLAAGTVCRPAAGACDAAEVCDGASAPCPADGFAPSGTPCGPGLECDGNGNCVPAGGGGACCEAPPGVGCLDGATCTDCASFGGTYYGPGSVCAGQCGGQLHRYLSFGGSIPDNNPAGLTVNLFVPDNFIVRDANLGEVQLQHTWVGDLIVQLTHMPSGTSVVLIDRPGLPANPPFGCGADNYQGITVDDEGCSAIETECANNLTSPPTYTPNHPLSAFDGLNAQGQWRLRVIDAAPGDVGQLFQWSLDLLE